MRESGRAGRVRLPWGGTTWVLTAADDIRAMLTDPRFSSDRLLPGFPFLVREPLSGPRSFTPSIINMDPPQHTAARHELVGEYTIRRLERLRPRIREIVEERFDALLAGPRPADLVSTVALPIPSRVICGQLGVPYADHEFFQTRSMALLRRQTTREQRQRTVDELQAYFRDLIALKAAEPADDLLSRQVQRRRATGDVNAAELASLAVLLVVAGHETTSNMIALGTLFLLENPRIHAELAADPSRVPDAVEELLRHLSVAEVATARIATADADLAGVRIRAGEGVIGLCHAGNRDPAHFTSPDEFALGRPNRHHHLAFGFGPHQCIGQNLARLELEVYFATLLRRVPDLRLAGPLDDVRFKHDSAVFGPYELPVTW
ncbi:MULTISPECIES: cytochrome P450 [unclassified Amycolatopsis]|uniref:cytochrome P450 n=1 Tax=unclassified Amycolatopsis TaxID=2618356 RepID=UPI002E1E52C8|nr:MULTISPECIES: cytochrome P450 [unclassified Amycolatopsis]